MRDMNKRKKSVKTAVAKAAASTRVVGGRGKSLTNITIACVALLALVAGVGIFVARMKVDALSADTNISVTVLGRCTGPCPEVQAVDAEPFGGGATLPQNTDGSYESSEPNASLGMTLRDVNRLVVTQKVADPNNTGQTISNLIFDQNGLNIGETPQDINVPIELLALGRNEFIVDSYNSNGDVVQRTVVVMYRPGASEFPLSGDAQVLNPDGSPAASFNPENGGASGSGDTFAVTDSNPILMLNGENVTQVLVTNSNGSGMTTLLNRSYEDPTNLNNFQFQTPEGSLQPGLNTLTVSFYGVGGQIITKTFYIYYFPNGIPLPPDTGYLSFGKVAISRTDFSVSIGLVVAAIALFVVIGFKRRKSAHTRS